MACLRHQADVFAYPCTDPHGCIVCRMQAQAYYDQFGRAVLEISINQHAKLYYDHYKDWKGCNGEN